MKHVFPCICPISFPFLWPLHIKLEIAYWTFLTCKKPYGNICLCFLGSLGLYKDSCHLLSTLFPTFQIYCHSKTHIGNSRTRYDKIFRFWLIFKSNFTFKSMHQSSPNLQQVNYSHIFIDTSLQNDLFL